MASDDMMKPLPADPADFFAGAINKAFEAHIQKIFSDMCRDLDKGTLVEARSRMVNGFRSARSVRTEMIQHIEDVA